MKYPKPPIREAVFDIRFELVKPYSISDFDPYKEYLKEKFPIHSPLNTIQATFKANAMNNPEVVNLPPDGFIFNNKENTRAIQISSTGFTFNVVNSYNEWNEHFGEFFIAFNAFVEICPIKSIQRIATRYINRILLPFEIVDFDDYIKYMPIIPSVLRPAFNAFFLSMSLPSNVPTRSVIINMTYETPNPQHIPFILDIDAFQIGQLDNDMDKVKELFGELRELKNNVFEDYITQKTRELFYE